MIGLTDGIDSGLASSGLNAARGPESVRAGEEICVWCNIPHPFEGLRFTCARCGLLARNPVHTLDKQIAVHEKAVAVEKAHPDHVAMPNEAKA